MTTQILEDNGRNQMHSSPIEAAMDPISHERTIGFGQETGVIIASNELDVHDLALELEVQEEFIGSVVTEEPTNMVDVVIKSDVQEGVVEAVITNEPDLGDIVVAFDTQEELVETVVIDESYFSDVVVELGIQEELPEKESNSVIGEVLETGEEIIFQLVDVATDVIDEVLDTGKAVLGIEDLEDITTSNELENSEIILDFDVQETSVEETVVISDILVDTNNISGLDIQCEDSVALSSDTSFVDYIWGFFHNPFASSGMDDTNSTDVVV